MVDRSAELVINVTVPDRGAVQAVSRIADAKLQLNRVFANNDAIRQLGRDIDNLNRIELFRAAQQDVRTTAAQLGAARIAARQLAEQYRATGEASAQVAAREMQGRVAVLTTDLQQQRAVLTQAAAGLREVGIAETNLAQQQAALTQAVQRTATQEAAYQQLGVRSAAVIRAEQQALRDAAAAFRQTGASQEEMRRVSQAAERQIESLNQELRGTSEAAGGITGPMKAVAATILSVAAARKVLNEVSEDVKLYSTFDDAIRISSSYAGIIKDTSLEFRALSAAARRAGADTSKTASDAAKGLGELTSKGYSAVQAIKLVNPLIKLAESNQRDFSDAARIASGTVKGLGKDIDYFGRVSDVITGISSRTAHNLLTVGAAAQQGIPAVKALGSSVEEFAAITGSLVDQLFEAGQSGTAFARMGTALVSPTIQGAAAIELMDLKTKDAKGNFLGLIPILEQLRDKQLDMPKAVALFGTEWASAALAAVGAIDKIKADYNFLKNETEGLTLKVAEFQEAGLGGSLRRLESATESVKLSIGENLAPVVKDLAEYLVNVAGNVQKNVDVSTQMIDVAKYVAIGFLTIKTGAQSAGIVINYLNEAYVKYLYLKERIQLLNTITPGELLSEGPKRIEYQNKLNLLTKEYHEDIYAVRVARESLNESQEKTIATIDGISKKTEEWKNKIKENAAEREKAGAADKQLLKQSEEAQNAAAAATGASGEAARQLEVKTAQSRKAFGKFAKEISSVGEAIRAIGLTPGGNGLQDMAAALDQVAKTGQIAGAAQQAAWAAASGEIETYTPRLLGAADAEEAALRQSLKTLAEKDKALEAQHKQVLYGGKLVIDYVGEVADASKMEQAALQPVKQAYQDRLDALLEVKSANGALIPGMQMVAGAWTNLYMVSKTSTDQQLDGLRGLKLGTSSLADELFELSLVGKTQAQVWQANKVAAAQYLQSAKELASQAKQAALAGNADEAGRLWDASAAAAQKADAMYRKLAVTVKTEWSPAMEEAHKKASELVTKYGSAAQKALDQAKAGYDKVADAARRGADAQAYFADKLKEIARESMTGAEAYEDQKRSAEELAAAAEALYKAGDLKGAEEKAKAAADAFAQLPKEVKEGEQVMISAAQSAQDRAAGIKAAAEISAKAYAAEKAEAEANAAAAQRNAEIIIAAERAIVAATAEKLAALEAGNAAAAAAADKEIAAAKARAEAAAAEVEAAGKQGGDDAAAKATQAQIDKIDKLVKKNEEAAAKIKALEEEKGKTISEESENAKIAAEGVVASQQQLTDMYAEQQQAFIGMAGAQTEIMKSVADATEQTSASIKAAAADANAELASIKSGIEAIPDNKTVTITVQEVQARFGGGPINMSGGARVSGPTGYDSVHALLAGNEFVINNKSTAEIGFGHFHYENTRQWDKALKSLAAFHGPVETSRLLSGFLPPQEITMRPLPTPALPPQQYSQPAGGHWPVLGRIEIYDHRHGERYNVYTEPDNAAKVARLLQDREYNEWLGSGRKGPRPRGI